MSSKTEERRKITCHNSLIAETSQFISVSCTRKSKEQQRNNNACAFFFSLSRNSIGEFRSPQNQRLLMKNVVGKQLSIFVSVITSVLNRQSIKCVATEQVWVGVFWSSQKRNVIGPFCPLVQNWFWLMWATAHMDSHESKSTYVAEGDEASEIATVTEEAAC